MGIHIIAEICGVEPGKISKVKKIRQVLDRLITKSGLHIVSSIFHQFRPYGVSGVYLLRESHLSIHTWPEYGYVALDIFSCKDDDSAFKAFESIIEELQPKNVKKRIIRRNILGKTRK